MIVLGVIVTVNVYKLETCSSLYSTYEITRNTRTTRITSNYYTRTAKQNRTERGHEAKN
jgi:hypothetical protein